MFVAVLLLLTLATLCFLLTRRPVYSNTVRNVWGRWSIFQQLLVQRGYTVVQVDLRGSTGNGRVFREEFTANVGGQDLEDLVATVSLLNATVQSLRGLWLNCVCRLAHNPPPH